MGAGWGEAMTKHTPGPWNTSIINPVYIDKGTKVTIALCPEDVHSDRWEEAKANARLIAAAPRVTEALSEMLTFFADRATTQLEIDAVNEGGGALAQAREEDDRQSRRTQHELPIPEPPDLPSIEEMSGSIHPDCEIFETRKDKENA